MRYNTVSILAASQVDPPNVVATRDIESQLSCVFSRLGLPNNFLGRVTGVHARRFWDEGVLPSQAATLAAKSAIEKAGLEPGQIDLLINTSVSRDYIEPSVACFVHRNLGLRENCTTFDVANACVGFLNGIQIAACMIEQGQVDYALIVDGEGARTAIETTIDRLVSRNVSIDYFKLRFATLTLGSGAAAMILANADKAGGEHRVLGSMTLSATEHNKLCLGSDNDMQTDAAGLMSAGVGLAERAYPIFLRTFDLTTEDVDQFIIHQVSKPHTDSVIRKLNWDNNKVYRLFPEYGNMGPAGMPSALCKIENEGSLRRGDLAALMGIGSGLTCTIIPILW